MDNTVIATGRIRPADTDDLSIIGRVAASFIDRSSCSLRGSLHHITVIGLQAAHSITANSCRCNQLGFRQILLNFDWSYYCSLLALAAQCSKRALAIGKGQRRSWLDGSMQDHSKVWYWVHPL